MSELKLSVSDFIASLNQTLEFAYPSTLSVIGELANFRVSKGRWVYFDLKDEEASLKCFGSVFSLPGPLEDGMLIEVNGTPRMNRQYGFSYNFQVIQPVGEGTLKRAADLLALKLEKEGLFADERKRIIPYPPKKIGLITSSESAAYADFIKILSKRWSGLDIELVDVLVQGELAPAQIINALGHFNMQAKPPDVLVITRGGGNAEDLWAFNTEHVTRAVAASRIPTLVAIGHETDLSLAERVADKRASTPSNAAELLVPDKKETTTQLRRLSQQLTQAIEDYFSQIRLDITGSRDRLHMVIKQIFRHHTQQLDTFRQLIMVLSPQAALKRGYIVARQDSHLIKRAVNLKSGSVIDLSFYDGEVDATVRNITLKGKEG